LYCRIYFRDKWRKKRSQLASVRNFNMTFCSFFFLDIQITSIIKEQCKLRINYKRGKVTITGSGLEPYKNDVTIQVVLNTRYSMKQ
jgi:hypothetical protein